jgi:hypothetical protein
VLYYTGADLGCGIHEADKHEPIGDTCTQSQPSSESSDSDSISTGPPAEVDVTDVAAVSTSTTDTDSDSSPDSDKERMYETSPDKEIAARRNFVENEKPQMNIKYGGKHEQLEGRSKNITERNENDVRKKQEAMTLPASNSGATVNQLYELHRTMEIQSYERNMSAAPGYQQQCSVTFHEYDRNRVAASQKNEQHYGPASYGYKQRVAATWRCEQHGRAASSRYEQTGSSTSRGFEKHGVTASRKTWQQETRGFVGCERKAVTTFMHFERQETTAHLKYKKVQAMTVLQKAQRAVTVPKYEDKEKRQVEELIKYKGKRQAEDGNKEEEKNGKERKAAALQEYEEEKAENEIKEEKKPEKEDNEKGCDKAVTLPECEEQTHENTESIDNFFLFSFPLSSGNRRPFLSSEEKSKKLKNMDENRRHYSLFGSVSEDDGQRPEPEKVSFSDTLFYQCLGF